MMNPLFEIHNKHLIDIDTFKEEDYQLRQLANQYYQYHFPLIDQLPINEAGIYTLGGGRQIGKSTLLKLWMLQLLTKHNIPANRITYLTGEIIDDHHALINYVNELVNNPTQGLKYLIIDEVTYIKDWDKAIKFLADSGSLMQVILLLTGSDLTMIKEARMRFPGRRGKSEQVNFHLYPLSFKEYLGLTQQAPLQETIDWKNLYHAFDNYLKHGGYLTAINDIASHGKILKSTLLTYSDWIRGDVLKRGKQERYLFELLKGIIHHYGSQITWTNLAKSLSIDHHMTVAEYCELLSSMDAIFIQYALAEDKLRAAPKKARRLWFCDPFIYHAIAYWINGNSSEPSQINQSLADPEICSFLVETAVISHFRRAFETYYIKGEGEVDIAYVNNKTFYPIELKWTNQLRSKSLKQISKYTNGQIWARTDQFTTLNNLAVKPLPWMLAQMD